MKITFSDLKEISSNIDRGGDEYLCQYLNQFEGDDIYQKFKNILKIWDLDVSPNLDLSLDGKSVKIQLGYIISEMPEDIGSDIKVIKDDLEYVLSIPKNFTPPLDVVPVYQIVESMKISGIEINFERISYQEKVSIINQLPPNIYNDIIDQIIKNPKIIKFENPVLKNIRLNFMINDIYTFLKGLFTPYGNDYFRDVIFHLSKRIDIHTLEKSTMQDVEYYIEKYNEELKDSQQTPTI